MRELNSEDLSQTSFAAFWATLCFALIIALGGLYLYARDIIQEGVDDRIVSEHQVGKLTEELKMLKAKHAFADQEMEKLVKMKTLTAKERDMLGNLQRCKADIMTYKAMSERHKAEIKTYEVIQLKSNEYIQMLLLKLGEKNLKQKSKQ